MLVDGVAIDIVCSFAFYTLLLRTKLWIRGLFAFFPGLLTTFR